MSSLKLCKESLNKIKSAEKDIDDEILASYFGNPNPSHFVKHLFGAEKDKNSETVNDANNS